MTAPDTRRAIDAVWRIESARIIAVLARMVRDVGLAEELAQDALVAALERWPESGIPDKPGAWLTAVAKHRAIDHLRRRKLLERKHQFVGWARFFSPTLFAECWADKALAQPTRFDPNKEDANRASRAEIVAAMR